MAASLNFNKFVKQAANARAFELAGTAGQSLLRALYGGLAEALYSNDGVFGDDSEALRAATEAALTEAEQRIGEEFAELYGSSISRAMLNTNAPVQGGELYKAFKEANSAYRGLSQRLLNRNNLRQRAWLKARGYQTKRSYLKRAQGNPGLHPQGQANFGVQSGLFAKQFRSVGAGGSLRSAVFVGDAKAGKKKVLVQQTVDASRGFSRGLYFGEGGVGKKLLVKDVAAQLSASQLDIALSAQTQFASPDDVASRVQYARLRRSRALPYNNERLAAAALGEAIRRAL